jgi:STAS domain
VTQVHDGRFLVELVSGVPVVAAPEEIDITNAPELRSALLQAAADGPGTLVAYMTRTRCCDSAGLHTLLAAHKRARAGGVRAAGERGGGQFRAEGGLAGGVLDTAVDGLAEHAAAGAAE